MDLYRTSDLKFNPMDSSHFENTFKRRINCPTTWANEAIVRIRSVKSEPKQFWMAGAGAKTFRWWSRSLKFGFRIHRDSLWGKRAVQIIQFFSDFLDQIAPGRSQNLLDVGARVQ